MRHQGLVILFCFVIAAVLSPFAQAQLSEKYRDWDEGPEGFLLTKKEKKEWAKIKSDADAERFIELFWAKRNPDPSSSFNQFRADFESKVRYADQHFSHGNHRGSVSARGQVLILMGGPDSRQVRGPAQGITVGAVTPGSVGDAEANTESWFYDPANLPKEFKVKGANLYFFFYEEVLDSNAFELDRTNRESFKAMSALSRAPEVYLLHPNLKEVPKPVSVFGGRTATAEHLAWIDGGEAPHDDIAIVISDLGVTDSANRPLWVHLELPPDAPKLDLLVGRVTAEDGEVQSNFEIDASPLPGQNGTFYHLTFPLAEGSYTVDIAGATGTELQLKKSFAAEISSVPAEGTWLSPIWLGTAVSPNPEALLGAAFTVGGWHLTPVSGPDLTRAAEIAYFGFVVRPALSEEGTVKLRSRVHVKRDGKDLGRPLEVPLETSKIYSDLYMYGNSIGLNGFPETGPWEIIFEVIESNSDTKVEKSLAINLTE
jgi:GWxTD domain-containing protein